MVAGQVSGSQLPRLKGKIKDPSGAAMSAVDVAVLRGSEVIKAVKSDPAGVFSFDSAAAARGAATPVPPPDCSTA
jgi:hypothetical protein